MLLHDESPEAVQNRESAFVLGTYSRTPFHPRSGKGAKLIDVASDSAASGKTPGTDLREGVHTLPMLYALQDDGPEAERLRVLLAQPISDDAEVDEALGLLRTAHGLGRAREVLADHAAAARVELGKLAVCPATAALSSLTTYVVDRTG